MSGYSCKACGAPVRVDDTGITRSCGCNTTVVASMSGTVYGRGHACEPTPTERLLAIFHKVGLDLMKVLGGRV